MEKALKEQGDQLFGKRSGLLTLWQTIAENFYPERADFTSARNMGDELCKNLMSSYPVLARRTLGDSFSAMLRPSAKEWFHIRTNRQDLEDTQAKQWLQWATQLQKRAMYDRVTQFTRATKEGDHDFASFGQCVISVELNRNGDALLYRCWHLRDVAWVEDDSGKICAVYRKWKPTARDLVRMFPKTVDQRVREKLEKSPFEEIDVWHIVMSADLYASMPNAKKMKFPYVSIYFDVTHGTVMEEVGQKRQTYVIPRWQTVSGSQYAHSPATVVALPDARLLQSITQVLLDAGEKAVTPPMLATQEAIRGDIQTFAGGVTWVDAEYDERLGAAIQQLQSDKSGLAFGVNLQQDIRQMIAEGFFLNKLNLPPQGGPDMTAYEVGQRVQEHIRAVMPLFEPMESDYNGQVCEVTFDILMGAGAFGRAENIPKSIQGAEIQFVFESPLREANDRAKATQLMEVKQVMAQVIDIDPTAIHIIDAKKATRDVLEAISPAEWHRDVAAVDAIIQAQQQEQQAQQMLALAQQGADVAQKLQGVEIQ